MTDIKLVAWDVYGTIIEQHYDECSDVPNPLKPRPGALEALALIKSKGIEQCTCSDGDLDNLKESLKEIGIKDWRDFFEDLYQMEGWVPKDFSYIIQEFEIKPENLLVIGDNYKIDIELAEKQGCHTIHIPEKNKFKTNPIDLKLIKRYVK